MQNVILTQLTITELKSLFREEFEAFLQRQQRADTDQWLNLDALCEYLPNKPAKSTVYSWVHKGRIPFKKDGKWLYFIQSEIDEWLRTGRQKTNVESVPLPQAKSKRKS